MDSVPRDALTNIVRQAAPGVGKPLRFEPITTGKFNTSYAVSGPGVELVARVAPHDDETFLFYERHMMWQEPGLHQRLREETDAPVPEVVAFDDSRRFIDRDVILMERLPGMPMTDAPADLDSAHVFREIGRILAEVHRVTEDRYGYVGPHRPMEPQPDWASAFNVMWNKLVDDIAATGVYDASVAARMRETLDRHLEIFDRPVDASLLHMDVWHQNILVDRFGQVTGLLDWDRALYGDPEIEFAVLDYCGVSVPEFWQGYGMERDTSRPARIRQLFYLLYEVQKYIVIRAGRQDDLASAQRYAQQSLRLAEPLMA